MSLDDPYRIVEETETDGALIQLIEDADGTYRLRRFRLKANGPDVRVSAPVHSDVGVLALARELFPDRLPFGGVPVDST